MPGAVVARKVESFADLWLSISQAALLLDNSRYRVLTNIARGRIQTQVVAGRTIVLREDVERVRDELQATRSQDEPSAVSA